MMNFFQAGDSFSWLRYMSIKSFKKYYPKISTKLWVSKEYSTVKTWNSEEVQDFHTTPSDTVDYLPLVKDLGVEVVEWEQPTEVTERFGLLDPIHQADIFRYWLLNTKGGFFSDSDIIYLSDWLVGLFECKREVCCYYGDFPIGFIGGVGEGSKWGEVYNTCLRSFTGAYQSFGASLIKQLWWGCPDGMINIPKSWFYKIDHHNIWQIWHRDESVDDLRAIHLYNGSALTQIYNRLLTPDNYKEYPSTAVNAIKEVLGEI